MKHSEIYNGDAWKAYFNDGFGTQTQVITGIDKKTAIENFEAQTGFVVDRITTIKKPTLTCGCCGIHFSGWQSPSHDTGYGTCEGCQEDEDKRANQMLDSLVKKIEAVLRPEKLLTFNKKTQDQKRAFAMRCVEQGIVSWSI